MRRLSIAFAVVLGACGDSGTTGTGAGDTGGSGGSTDGGGGSSSGGSSSGGSSAGGSGGAETGGGGSGGGTGSGTVTWTADGTDVTTAMVNALVDPITIPGAGFASFSVVAATADAMESMSIVFFFAGGETIPAGSYTCGAFPNFSDSMTIAVAHTGIAAQALDTAASNKGACVVTLDSPATQGSLLEGSFTITAERVGSAGADIEITNGEFSIQDM